MQMQPIVNPKQKLNYIICILVAMHDGISYIIECNTYCNSYYTHHVTDDDEFGLIGAFDSYVLALVFCHEHTERDD